MSMETALLATLVLPLVGMVLIWLTGNSPNLREGVTLVTAVALFAIVLALLDAVIPGEEGAAHRSKTKAQDAGPLPALRPNPGLGGDGALGDRGD